MNTKKVKPTTFRLPEELYSKLVAEAEKLNITVNAMIKVILSERYLKD